MRIRMRMRIRIITRRIRITTTTTATCTIAVMKIKYLYPGGKLTLSVVSRLVLSKNCRYKLAKKFLKVCKRNKTLK